MTVTSLAQDSRFRRGAPWVKASRSKVAMVTWAFLEGGTFSSERLPRITFTASFKSSTALASCVKVNSSFTSGHFWSMRKPSSPTPSAWGSACQISSVIKGMKGCSSLSVSVST